MLDPKDTRFRDCWEDGVAPRWKDAPDDPKYGFGKDRTRFRVLGMTFLGHAGLLDVYLGTLGDANNPGIQFCRQASDGYLIGNRWVSCSVYDDAFVGADSDDPGWGAAIFARHLRANRLAVSGVPPRPDALPEVFGMMRAEYARIAGIVSFPPSLSADPDSGFVAVAPGRQPRHRPELGPTDAVRFIGTVGDVDVWQDGNLHPSDHVRLVAVDKDGMEQGYAHDVRRSGSFVPLGSPRWAQAVVNWLMLRCAGAKPTPAAPPVPWFSDEDLADALRESEWHGRFVAATKGTYPDSARCLLSWVKDRRTATTRSYPGQEALHDEMLGIIDEITSGRIYGSPDRCAVCGGGGTVKRHGWTDAEHRSVDPYLHPTCDVAACDGETADGKSACCLPAAAAILRARRLLAEKRHEVPAFAATASSDASGTIRDRSGHGNDLTTKPGNPLPCAGCGKPSTRPLGAVRVCDACGDLLLWSRAGGKAEVLARLAAEHAEAMVSELRDPYMRHGLVEMAMHLFHGRRGWSAAAPLSIAGKSADEAEAARQRQKDAENRMVDALLSERSEEVTRRYHASRVRTESECRAVRERMIREQVPAWLDPRRK